MCGIGQSIILSRTLPKIATFQGASELFPKIATLEGASEKVFPYARFYGA